MLNYTPEILPFLFSLAFTLGLGVVAAGRKTPAATTFFWLMGSLSVWTLCYILELSSVTAQGKFFWVVAKYFGAAAAPVLWFLFSLHATSREAWLTRPVRLALGGWVALTLLVVWTNSAHHLMWTWVALEPGQPELQAGHGLFFWAYAAAIYGFILASVVLFTHFYRTAQPLFRRQGLLLTLGGFAPLAGRMSEDVLGLDLLPRVDEVIFFFLVSAILFALALFRYNALRMVPIAHHLVIHNIRAGIIVLDPAGRIVDLNPFARELFGLAEDNIIGAQAQKIMADLMQPPTSPGFEEELTLLREGTTSYFSVQRSPIQSAQGRLNGHALVLFDVTARRVAERQLEQLAQTDALTGLTNRRQFLHLAEAEVLAAQQQTRPFAVLMLDIDHFKNINDTFGHPVGDEVLRQVAEACRVNLRPTDVLARYGGEEFVALLPQACLDDACVAAERLRQAVESLTVQSAGHTISVTLSVGVAVSGGSGASLLTAYLAQADAALYASKTQGRNRVTVATELVTSHAV
ncbi:diguanylate cyclase [Deinococcus oregonensis]|uniref:Diguanylate cyclase n=1 Tax=Deinococcus oregonensis TaxID=1805970 RepID=A0ABV6B5B1_9DEIO